MGFEVYPDQAGKYRWRFVVANGQTVATSGEAFASKGNAKRAIAEFKEQAAKSSVPPPEPDDAK
jgi:uncharacterized protein YegP (UPF0339 family)